MGAGEVIQRWRNIQAGNAPRLRDALRNKEYESMQHKPAPLRPDQLKGRDALTDWAIGVGERGTNPLQAMANYSQEFQDMSPMDQAMQILGGGMAGTIGKIGKGVTKQPIWTPVDTAQHPLGTQWSPRSNYTGNPNYKTPTDRPDAYGLPTRKQYDDILSTQESVARTVRNRWEAKVQDAIDADAKRAAEIGNVQPSGGIPYQQRNKDLIAELNKARQDELRYGDGQAMSVPAKTKFELAHEVAQRNAALPVSEGGLGLPANNMPLDRAKAMGFDTPAYHGTAADIKAFDPGKGSAELGKNREGASWFSSAPEVASEFAGNQMGQSAGGIQLGNSNIIPVILRKQELAKDLRGTYAKHGGMGKKDVADLLAEGKSGVHWPESQFDLPDTTMQGPVTGYYRNAAGEVWGESVPYPDQYGIVNPSQIRSRFAAFDPMRRHEADIMGNIDPQLLKILAGGSAAGLLGTAGYSTLQNKEGQ